MTTTAIAPLTTADHDAEILAAANRPALGWAATAPVTPAFAYGGGNGRMSAAAYRRTIGQ
jgi:hypothetical protein